MRTFTCLTQATLAKLEPSAEVLLDMGAITEAEADTIVVAIERGGYFDDTDAARLVRLAVESYDDAHAIDDEPALGSWLA